MTTKRFVAMQALGGAVINAVLNGFPALLIMGEDTKWHLWNGFPSLVLDTCGMAFGIAWGTGWIVTSQLRKQVASGKVTLPAREAFSARAQKDLGNWPASAFHRGFNLGALAVLLFALPVIGMMLATGVESWGRWPVFVFKTVFGAVVGAVVTPMVAVGVAVERPATVVEAVVPSEG
jgi:hypothetical protein